MAFWDRDRDPKQFESKITPWEEAKLISSEVAAQPEILAPGWYFYKENYLWHGLKPNDNGEGFLKGYDFQALSELQKWLGVSIPHDLIDEETNRQSLSEQLANLKGKSQYTAPSEPTAVIEKEANYVRKRDMNIHIKVTPQEYAQFIDRVEKSGMTKTNYLIRCAIQGEIPTNGDQNEVIVKIEKLSEDLATLMAEVGRQGGLLKMVIKPNEGQRPLHQEEWEALIRATQDQAKIKKKIEKTLEIINGYFKTLDI